MLKFNQSIINFLFMKKILLLVIILFSFFSFDISYAVTEQQEMLNDQWWNDEDSAYNDEWDLTSKTFMINVDSISPWINSPTEAKTTTQRVNWLLGTIIQKMMIALWSLSIFIMTIWAGYMVLHNWQDELLSKWKSIFMAWIYSVLIALSSYYLISIIRFMLYST